MITNNFKTTDIGLAAYLKTKDIDLAEIENISGSFQCTFVFRIDESDEYLQGHIRDWNESKECNKLKRFMHMYNLMKKGIKDTLSKPNGN